MENGARIAYSLLPGVYDVVTLLICAINLGLLFVCLSVRLSVTFVHCARKVRHIIISSSSEFFTPNSW